jgi:hypothetical protein
MVALAVGHGDCLVDVAVGGAAWASGKTLIIN